MTTTPQRPRATSLRRSTGRRRAAALAALVIMGSLFVGVAAPHAGADVTTAANDNLRTGWYPAQTTLSPGLVTGGTFGPMWASAVTGQVYAQPVLSQGTLFVATEQNQIYGLNPTTGAQLWSRSLGTPWNANDVGCGDLLPASGITGTPVVDPATNTAYFFAKTYNSGTSGPAAWFAHGVSLATGAEVAGFPVRLQGSASNDATHTFNPTTHLQRPGLLLMSGVVYAAFGGQCDKPNYEGWVVGVTTAGAVSTLWTTEAGRAQSSNPGAGIWQSGGGLVSDGPGQILLATGNGNIPSGATPGATPPGALGHAVVRLQVQPDQTLKSTDFFMPYDASFLNSWDADLGSGAPMELPPAYFGTATYPHLALEIGKQGYLYVLDADHLGGYQQGTGGSDQVINRLGGFGGAWSKPAAWPGQGGYVYITTASGGNTPGGTSGALKALKYGLDGAGKPTFSLVGTSSDSFGFSSSSPVVSSNGTAAGSALVWVVWSPDGSGANAQLRAYDPVPINGTMQLRWSTGIGTASKFAVPLIDGNRVYVGTRDGQVRSYGSPVTSPLVGAAVTFPTTTVGQSSAATATLTANYDLTVTSVGVAGAGFSAGVTSPPVPTPVAKNGILSVPLTFTPTSATLFAGTLTLDTTSGPVSVSLSGTGQTVAGQLVANPSTISFGGTTVGGVPVTASLTLHNSGAQPVTITSVTSPAAPFTATGLPGVGTVISPGQDVTATVSYAPVSAGLSASAIGVVSSGGTVSVPISGTASLPSTLQISSLNPSLGSVDLGNHASGSVTLTNTGGSNLTITRSKPPTGGDFSVTGPVPEGTTLTPGQSMVASVSFAPTRPLLQTGTWEFNANDTSGVQKVVFAGTGIRPGVPGTPSALGWSLNGSAAFSGPSMILTPNAANQKGSSFSTHPMATAGLQVAFDARIDQGTGGDGMAMVLADPTVSSAASLGQNGGGLGFSGLSGVAVALDTYRNGADPSSNFVGVATTSSGDNLTWAATSTAVPVLTNATHRVVVTILGGRVKVSVDGAAVIDQAVTVTPYALIGFTAGTGGHTDRHTVSNVVFSRVVGDLASPEWASNGAATRTGGAAQLNAKVPYSAGSVFWPGPVKAASTTVDFDLAMGGGSGGAGAALVLADAFSVGPSALGTNAGGLGAAGISGVTIAFDTVKNPGDPSVNFVGLSVKANSSGALLYAATNAGVGPLRTGSHHVRVVTSSGHVVVQLDGATVLDVPAALSQQLLVGFTGATGVLTDLHRVSNLVVTSV